MYRIEGERTASHSVRHIPLFGGPANFDFLGRERVRSRAIPPENSLEGRATPDLTYIQYLCDLHDRAGDLQRSLLTRYPDGRKALPRPLSEDLEYYDGAQFYMLHISGTLEAAGRERRYLTPEQHILLVSTNGLNDWWIDESTRSEEKDENRNYSTVIEAFDGINDVCYSYINPNTRIRPIKNLEVQNFVNYYQFILNQMPNDQRATLAKLLISINLYQGISLYQERGFREYLGLGNIDFSEKNRQMLEAMQLEKGGIAFTYFWPYFPEITEGIDIPSEPPTIQATIQNFLAGNSIYSRDGLGRRILEIGEVNQMMDDSCDARLDRERGVVSPENLDGVYAERSTEGWDDRVVRILEKLETLRGSTDNEEQKLVVDAGVNAVGGLTLFRANRHMSRKEQTLRGNSS